MVTDALIVAALIIFVTLRFCKPLIVVILAVVELILLLVILPNTVSAVKLPKLVMLASVPAVSVPLNDPPTIVPGTVRLPIVALITLNAAEVILPVAVRSPPIVALPVTANVFVVVLPTTVKFVKLPKVVMFG